MWNRYPSLDLSIKKINFFLRDFERFLTIIVKYTTPTFYLFNAQRSKDSKTPLQDLSPPKSPKLHPPRISDFQKIVKSRGFSCSGNLHSRLAFQPKVSKPLSLLIGKVTGWYIGRPSYPLPSTAVKFIKRFCLRRNSA